MTKTTTTMFMFFEWVRGRRPANQPKNSSSSLVGLEDSNEIGINPCAWVIWDGREIVDASDDSAREAWTKHSGWCKPTEWWRRK